MQSSILQRMGSSLVGARRPHDSRRDAGATLDRGPAHSREAAPECSPRRKPWVACALDQALKGRKKRLHVVGYTKVFSP